MKFKFVSVVAAVLTLTSLAGCQTAAEIRAERAKKGEQVERMTGSNIPRKDSTSDVKVVSGETIRSLDAAAGAAAGAAGGSGR